MKLLRPALIALVCASITACADNPPRQAEPDYRSRPVPSNQSSADNPGESRDRLTIQSGEGERLNLPWFIQGTQDWINGN